MIGYDEGLQRTPELERRQQSCVAFRFLHEVQYHTVESITTAVKTVVAATAEEQVSPHHPRCVYHPTAVQQSKDEKPIHQQPTIPPCVYNNSTAVQKKKKAKRRDREIQLTLCPESSALPLSQHKNVKVVITHRLREGNFEKSSLAEFGCDARSFAGDCEGCCVGGIWRGRAVSGDRVAPWDSRC